ncbi:MAG: SDR family oxidoreductase [Anaerolineae bacterium]|nr:SDR family oxidoreductase [Anaerolineae bacterium]
MAGKILITGAPGNVGTHVVRELMASAPADVRVAAWDVNAARTAFAGVSDIVPFDFLKPETFGPAFAGVDRLFLVRPPQLANVERDIAPAVRFAVQAGVRRVVFLSLQGVEKNRVVPHHKIELLLRGLPVRWTFLRASFFMQNLSTTHRAEIRDRGEIALPVGRARTSFIDARDIANVAARTLTESGHEDRAYTLTGSAAFDYYEVAGILSDVLGRPIRYTDPSIPAFILQQRRAGRPLGFTLVMAALYTITRFGNASQVTPDVQRVLGRAPISFHAFAEAHRACWLPG